MDRIWMGDTEKTAELGSLAHLPKPPQFLFFIYHWALWPLVSVTLSLEAPGNAPNTAVHCCVCPALL